MDLQHTGLAEFSTWVEESTASGIVSHERLATVRPAWKITVRRHCGSQSEYVLRCARPAGFGLANVYTLQREAVILDALSTLSLPVPKVIAVSDDPEALLLECLPGDGDFAALVTDPVRRTKITHHFIELLAILHAASPASLSRQTGLPLPASNREHAENELNIWRNLYINASRRQDSLLTFALGWLKRHLPIADRTVLVQGDTGPNQCLFGDTQVCAMLDWELAHFGDPMEDLGWIAARSFFMDFGDLPGLFAYYQQLTGNSLDGQRIRYYRIQALVKCAIATGLAREGATSDDDIASIMSWDAVTRRALTYCLRESLADSSAATAPVPQVAEAPESSLHTLVADALAGMAAQQPDAYQRQRIEGMALVANYLGREAQIRVDWRQLDERAWRELPGAADDLGADELDHNKESAVICLLDCMEQREFALLQSCFGDRVDCLFSAID